MIETKRRPFTPWRPINWLSRPISLLENGAGPTVYGVVEDAPLGKWLLQQLEARARKEDGC
jgi:hypothetical protein